jgi:hypothetical protein|tara:strand:+ start:874 stop:1080 length:207 start_codon:yes stop_codon:yes gene_type:complete
MSLDTTILALLVSLVVSVLGGGVWLGRLWEKAGNNAKDIQQNRHDNAREHRSICDRLDSIARRLNGTP